MCKWVIVWAHFACSSAQAGHKLFSEPDFERHPVVRDPEEKMRACSLPAHLVSTLCCDGPQDIRLLRCEVAVLRCGLTERGIGLRSTTGRPTQSVILARSTHPAK